MEPMNQYSEIMELTNWKTVYKRKHQVYVCMPRLGTKIYNILEDIQYKTSEDSPFILSGTVGELRVINSAQLFETYQSITGEPLSFDYLKTKGYPHIIDWFRVETIDDNVPRWALFVPGFITFPVQTSEGDILRVNGEEAFHDDGDYLVCPDKDGVPNIKYIKVVNGEVFPKTYGTSEFSGKFEDIFKDIPEPKSIK